MEIGQLRHPAAAPDHLYLIGMASWAAIWGTAPGEAR